MESIPVPTIRVTWKRVPADEETMFTNTPDGTPFSGAPAEMEFFEPSKYAGLRVTINRASLWKGELLPEHAHLPKLDVGNLPGDPIEETWLPGADRHHQAGLPD
jgi:hypothetical protein